MNKKRLSLFFVIAFSCANINAQEVVYYKLVRANSNKDVYGGQFITFVGAQCFESNKYGVSVEHGRLIVNKNYSNSQYTVYQGSSYWGSSTTFKFKADKSVLNVKLDNGDVYVYKRATPPAGQTTCSLIRQRSSSSGSGGTYTPTPTYPVQQYPQQQYPQQQYPQQQQYDNPQPTPQPQPQQKKICKWCNGTRRISKENGFSLGMEKEYCSECRQTVVSGHYHIDCPYCHGTGYE